MIAIGKYANVSWHLTQLTNLSVSVVLRTLDNRYNKWGAFSNGKFNLVRPVSLSGQLNIEVISVSCLNIAQLISLILIVIA